MYVFFILGVVLLISAIKANPIRQAGIDAASQGVAGLWVLAFATLLLAVLGIVGACTEKSLLLKVFCGFLLIEVVVLVIIGIIVASAKSKVKDSIVSSSAELMQSEELRQIVNGLQRENKCCGLASYKDWAGEIPDSCSCQSYSSSDCMAVEDKQIYKQPCLGLILYYIDLVFNITLGMVFGFAAFELYGLLVGLGILRQIMRYESGAAM
ncbi:tetraspanin-8-like [Aplochiton taeniatus]